MSVTRNFAKVLFDCKFDVLSKNQVKQFFLLIFLFFPRNPIFSKNYSSVPFEVSVVDSTAKDASIYPLKHIQKYIFANQFQIFFFIFFKLPKKITVYYFFSEKS